MAGILVVSVGFWVVYSVITPTPSSPVPTQTTQACPTTHDLSIVPSGSIEPIPNSTGYRLITILNITNMSPPDYHITKISIQLVNLTLPNGTLIPVGPSQSENTSITISQNQTTSGEVDIVIGQQIKHGIAQIQIYFGTCHPITVGLVLNPH